MLSGCYSVITGCFESFAHHTPSPRRPDRDWSDPGLCPSSNPRICPLEPEPSWHLFSCGCGCLRKWLSSVSLPLCWVQCMLCKVTGLKSHNTRPPRDNTWLSSICSGNWSSAPHTCPSSAHGPLPSIPSMAWWAQVLEPALLSQTIERCLFGVGTLSVCLFFTEEAGCSFCEAPAVQTGWTSNDVINSLDEELDAVWMHLPKIIPRDLVLHLVHSPCRLIATALPILSSSTAALLPLHPLLLMLPLHPLLSTFFHSQCHSCFGNLKIPGTAALLLLARP